MNSDNSFDKVQVIERSLRCFGNGLVGLLPVVGLPWAIIALGHFLAVSQHKGNIWNPAERYLGIGALCATLGLSLTLLIGGVIAIEISF